MEVTEEVLARSVWGAINKVNSSIQQSSYRENEYETAKQAFDILKGQYGLVQELLDPELNELNQKPSSVDIPVVQEKVASLEGLQQALKESFDSLSVKVTQNAENMRNYYVTQAQWNELKIQIDNNSARITELSAVTRDTLGTTSLLLKGISKQTGNAKLAWGSEYLNLASIYTGNITDLVQARSLGLFRSKGAHDAKNEKTPEVASSNDVRKPAKTLKNPFKGNPLAAERPNIGGPSGLPLPTQQSPVDTSMHDRFARYNPFSKDSTPRSVAVGYKIPAKQAIPRETRRIPSPPHSATNHALFSLPISQNTLDRTDDSLSSSQFPMRPYKPRNQASEDPVPPSRGSSFSSRGSGIVPSVATTLTASSGVSNSPSPRTGSPLKQSDDPVQSVPVPSVSGRINHFENFGTIMGKEK